MRLTATELDWPLVWLELTALVSINDMRNSLSPAEFAVMK